VIDHARRVQLADELLRRFASALRSAQLYSPTHPLVARNVSAFLDTFRTSIGQQRSMVVGVVAGEFVVGDVPLPRTSAMMGDLLRRLQRAGVERITIERDVAAEEVVSFVRALGAAEPAEAGEVSLPSLPHIQLGRVQVQQRVETSVADTATVRRLYSDATAIASQLWDAAAADGKADPTQARTLVDSLAQAVAHNRTALIALTALKNYDNYTFTHMVNVSILTMAQARALGIDGAVLREFGIAALMHDIGKVRTPAEILNKPDRLTEPELAIMQRHVLDGAEILRRTSEIPAIAPVVAFEHHLRIDGSGYPGTVRRPLLNLATQLCGIADVYDAMRSHRGYQQAFPSERILTVLQRNDGTQFDQNLVRRFVQIIGIYPVGNLVRLNTGEIGVVIRAYSPDPHRPQVRVILDHERRPYPRPYDVNLWQSPPGGRHPSQVIEPLDPVAVGVDPLAVL
jgi:putative nucleotidyltransferase with HDIG domain